MGLTPSMLCCSTMSDSIKANASFLSESIQFKLEKSGLRTLCGSVFSFLGKSLSPGFLLMFPMMNPSTKILGGGVVLVLRIVVEAVVLVVL